MIANMLERYLGRPIRDMSWWMWLFLALIVTWAWPLVVLYLIGRLVIDMMEYAPSETRFAALSNGRLPEIPTPVRSVDANEERPASGWWDLDSISVGEDHNRPENEWWDIGDAQVGSKKDPASDNDRLIQFWSIVGMVFLLTFLVLGANGMAFTFALLSTSMLLVVFYQIGPVRSILGVE